MIAFVWKLEGCIQKYVKVSLIFQQYYTTTLLFGAISKEMNTTVTSIVTKPYPNLLELEILKKTTTMVTTHTSAQKKNSAKGMKRE